MKKALSILICLIVIILTFTSCGSENPKRLYYMTSDTIATLDPQLASNKIELMVAEGMFEGLYTSSKGEIVLGAASNVIISDDGLCYTFTLRDDIYWSNGDAVQANDFVFGIQRALNPTTKAPYAYKLYCIKNAQAVHSGELDYNSLGVKALDEKTVEITLEYSYTGIEHVLSLPVAMPCNADFFEKTGGRYGLNVDDIISNGTYYAKLWDENGITLSINKHFREDAVNAGVTVAYKEAEDNVLNLINNGQLDMGEVSGMDTLLGEDAEIGESTSLNTCYAVFINKNADSGIGNSEIAKALNMSLNRDETFSNLPSCFLSANSIIAPDLTVGGQRYGDSITANSSWSYNAEEAKNIYNTAVSKMSGKKLPQTTLIYPNEAGVSDAVKALVQTWQKNLGCYIDIKGVTSDKAINAVASSNYQIAIIPLTAYDGTAGSLITEFGTSGRYKSVSDSGFDEIINENLLSQSQDKLSLIASAEKYLIESGYVIPLFYGNTGVTYSGNIDASSIYSAAGGYLSLKEIIKK
mgnify:CR=1 FL=1